jgi:hypothetical protein
VTKTSPHYSSHLKSHSPQLKARVVDIHWRKCASSMSVMNTLSIAKMIAAKNHAWNINSARVALWKELQTSSKSICLPINSSSRRCLKLKMPSCANWPGRGKRLLRWCLLAASIMKKTRRLLMKFIGKGTGSIWREGKRRSSLINLCFSVKRVKIKLILICRNSKRLPRKPSLSWQISRKLWPNNTYPQQRE